MSRGKKSVGRRTFLGALFTGAGVVTALGVAPPGKASAKKESSSSPSASAPVLYRRTKDVERYYRTLYT